MRSDSSLGGPNLEVPIIMGMGGKVLSLLYPWFRL